VVRREGAAICGVRRCAAEGRGAWRAAGRWRMAGRCTLCGAAMCGLATGRVIRGAGRAAGRAIGGLAIGRGAGLAACGAGLAAAPGRRDCAAASPIGATIIENASAPAAKPNTTRNIASNSYANAILILCVSIGSIDLRAAAGCCCSSRHWRACVEIRRKIKLSVTAPGCIGAQAAQLLGPRLARSCSARQVLRCRDSVCAVFAPPG
jgi:hypothetical protein